MGIVAGRDADQAALDLVVRVLRGLGIAPVVRRDGSVPTTPVTIHVGSAEQTPSTANALAQLGVAGPEGIPAQGYVLASGVGRDGRSRIVLAGVDGTGTFYAAQTLRQVIAPGPGRPHVPGLVVRDWPGFGFRGGMESFYYTPWSQADRLAQIDFLAAHKMDTFFYGPGDDPRTGTLWDSPYEVGELSRLQQVVERGRGQHVGFIYRVSPEAPLAPQNGICHARADDRTKLLARFEQLWAIGVRQFTIAWDDVAGGFRCDQDQQAYGDDPSPLAAAQADVVNYVQEHFIDTHPGAKPLITVPTEYSGNRTTTYRTRFDTLLTRAAQIYWTGPSVVSPSISLADITAAQAAFPRHKLIVWDNYPVNDWLPFEIVALFLGPSVERDPRLAEHALGVTFNEMNQQAPSQVALFTQADYAWNPVAYDPDESWDRGLRALGADVYPALRTFTENNYGLSTWPNLSPLPSALSPLLSMFRDAYTSFGDVGAAAGPVDAEFARMAAAPATLRAGLDDPLFLAQTSPWLDKLGLYGVAGPRAVNMLHAQVDGDLVRAWARRLGLEQTYSLLPAGPHVIAPDVDPFLQYARTESDGWLGARWYGGVASVSGSPVAASGSSLAAAADGDVTTAYRAAAQPDGADALTVTLTAARPVDDVVILQDADKVAHASVQGRTPGGDWVDLGTASDAAAELAAGGRVLDAVRLTWADRAPPPTVYEIVPVYSDALSARLTVDQSRMLMRPASQREVEVTLQGVAAGELTAALSGSAPDGWSVQPAEHDVSVRSEGRTVSATQRFTISVPDGTAAGTYPVRFTASSDDGRHATPVTVSVQVAASGSSKAYRDLVLDDQPTGYWRLDESTGTTSADSSGRGHAGEYRAPLEYGATGALARPSDTNAAVRLTGGYINVPNSSDLQITGPFTLEAWIKPDGEATDPGAGIIERYDSSPSGYVLRLVGGNRVQAWILGTSGVRNVTGSTAVPVGSWHHVAAVYDGTRLTVYVDGQPDGAVTTTVAPGAGSGDLRLGARGDDANQRFAGGLDEVAVYRSALTAEQVATHYLTGITG